MCLFHSNHLSYQPTWLISPSLFQQKNLLWIKPSFAASLHRLIISHIVNAGLRILSADLLHLPNIWMLVCSSIEPRQERLLFYILSGSTGTIPQDVLLFRACTDAVLTSAISQHTTSTLSSTFFLSLHGPSWHCLPDASVLWYVTPQSLESHGSNMGTKCPQY